MTTAAPLPTPYFLARPSGAPRGGIVLLMEGNGIGWQLLRVAERLAGEGYVVVAPDVYHRLHAEHGDWAKAYGALREEEALHDIREAAAVARAQGARRVGITGFCMGGRLAYLASVRGVDLQAAAPFYGAGIDSLLAAPGCPLLACFGGRDEWIPAEAIERVRARHGEDVVVYPEAGHGFMRDGSEDYRPDAARDAWSRLLAFFAQHLR
jgi:carboxymethylenebutenolidase